MPHSDIANAERKGLPEYQLGEISGVVKGGRHKLTKISEILNVPYSTIKHANIDSRKLVILKHKLYVPEVFIS